MATTKSGFEYEVNEAIFDDWEFFEHIREAVKLPVKIIDLGLEVLGEEQYNKLKEHCRNEQGKVSRVRMNAELTEIILAASSGAETGEIKK